MFWIYSYLYFHYSQQVTTVSMTISHATIQMYFFRNVHIRLIYAYGWLSLHEISQSTFPHIHGFISISWGGSASPLSNFKAYYLRQTFSRLISECDANDKRSIKEFWPHFNIKTTTFIRFPFYAFSMYAAIRRNTTPVYNETHLYWW
jgi:hypothetical protein